RRPRQVRPRVLAREGAARRDRAPDDLRRSADARARRAGRVRAPRGPGRDLCGRHGRHERRDAPPDRAAAPGAHLRRGAPGRAVRRARDAESLPARLEEKRALVNRTGIVEFLPSVTGIDDIGGLEIMKKWLLDRRKLFQMRDELSAEIVAKGVRVTGISGCGQTI